MTVRHSATALAVALAMLLTPTWAQALWSATATGQTSAAAATLTNAGAFTASCTTAAATSPVELTWTASPDGWVTTYEIVRTRLPDGPRVVVVRGAGESAWTDHPPNGAGLGYAYAIRARAALWSTGLLAADAVVSYTAHSCSPALAPAPAGPTFSVLAGAGGVTSTGSTVVSGDLGTAPGGPLVGFPPGVVSGSTHLGDATAVQAQSALAAAYDEADARTPTSEFSGDLDGTTFAPGVHHTSAALALTGTLTLDGGGDPDAVFVVQVDAAVGTAAGSTVALVDGARPENVVWHVEGAVGLGAGSAFAGTVLSAGDVTVGAGTHVVGRVLTTGAVTLAGNSIRFTAAPAPTVTITGGSATYTADTTPTISGSTSADPGATVTVTIAGQTRTTPAGPGGSWSVTTSALAGGTYEVRASVQDAAGNRATAVQSLTVEVDPAPVALRSLSTFAVLAGTGGVTSTGQTVVDGDLGVAPGQPLVGFPPGVVSGSTHLGDPVAEQALADLVVATLDADGRVPTRELSGDLGGTTLRPGVMHASAALALTGTLVLDGQGDPNAVFVVQVDAALDTAAGSTVLLVGGAQAANVVWQVQGAVGLGAGSTFAGTVLAGGAITVGAGAELAGRALSAAAVTLARNRIG